MSESDNLYEEDQNIDDLVDYNDFDSKDLDSKDDMDSFNNDILKFYEDHKKNVNAKGNEVSNAQRPISSYHRVVVTDNNKKENSEITKKREDDDQVEKTDREGEIDVSHANDDENIYEDKFDKYENFENDENFDNDEKYENFDNAEKYENAENQKKLKRQGNQIHQEDEEINYDDFNEDFESSKSKILGKSEKSGNKSENKSENKNLQNKSEGKNPINSKSKDATPISNKSQKNSIVTNTNNNSSTQKISESQYIAHSHKNSNSNTEKIFSPLQNTLSQNINLINQSFIIDYSLQDLEHIKSRLNTFIKSHSISKSQFCDNTSLLLCFDDFFDLFRKIRFDLSRNEAKILFNHLNPNKDEGYIMVKHFYSNHGFEFKEVTFENTTEGYDLDRLNQQFKTLHSEILDVIKKDLVDHSSKRVKTAKYRPNKLPESANKKRNIISAVSCASNALSSNQINSTGIENMTRSHDVYEGSQNFENFNNNSLRSFNRPVSNSKLILSSIKNSSYLENPQSASSKPKIDVKDLLKAKIRKEKEEDNLMRQNFDKRQKDFIKDCTKKMEEANRICAELGLMKSFSIYTEDNGAVKCQIHDHNNPYDVAKIELKSFIVEWRILNKTLIKKNNSEGFKSPNNAKFTKLGLGAHGGAMKSNPNLNPSSGNNFGNSQSSGNHNYGSSSPGRTKNNQQVNTNESPTHPYPLRLEKQEIRRQIKKVLISSIRLKMKLKTQVDSLKNKYYIDEKVILQNLKLPLKKLEVEEPILTTSDT